MQGCESILVVHSDATTRAQLQSMLTDLGYAVDLADSCDAALVAFGRATWAVVFAAFRLKDGSGLALVQAAHERATGAGVILVGDRRQATALAALRGGAADYLPMPIGASDLAAALGRRLRARVAHAASDDNRFERRRTMQINVPRLTGPTAQRQLAVTLAHAINNPLTPIISMAELLLEDLPPDHPGRIYVTAISAAAWRIRDVVRNLYDPTGDQAAEESHAGF